MVIPVRGGKAGYGNACFAVCMQNFIISGVNSNMSDALAAAASEEDEIAFAQAAAVDFFAFIILLLRSAWKRNAILFEHILGKGRAVKVGCAAARRSETVWYS